VKEAWDSKEWVAGPVRSMLELYGFDVLKAGSIMEFYSSTLNLVTTIDEFFVAPRPGRQSERFGSAPFKCVGVLADPKMERVTNPDVMPSQDMLQAPLPLEAIDDALAAGRRLLYVSMGTVATSAKIGFWSKTIGRVGADNGLEDVTGKQLTQHVFRCCIDAVGEDDDFLVVMALGPQSDALEGLLPLLSNFIVRSAVPQLEILPRCTAFVTHGGANSMHEALSLSVPMAVVPIFGDQPLNADSVARCGAGLSFRQPMSSVSRDSLCSAIRQLTAEDGNTFRAACKAMSKKISDAGGVDAAAKAILEVVSGGASSVRLGGA